jgi:hypothetical protein
MRREGQMEKQPWNWNHKLDRDDRRWHDKDDRKWDNDERWRRKRCK